MAIFAPNAARMQVHSLTFNPFQENTYLIADADGTCAIVDPGCYTPAEQAELHDYVRDHNLRPVACWLTHAHLDHILGCAYVHRTWGLVPLMTPGEKPLYDRAVQQAQMYGIPGVEAGPVPTAFLQGETLTLGSLTLQVLPTPGHSPASVCLYHAASGQVIAGDVLFAGSIGRTDLPGGSYEVLLRSIHEQLLTLPDATRVYPGHGPSTTIGIERGSNPFLGG